jgi:hypothetical protein
MRGLGQRLQQRLGRAPVTSVARREVKSDQPPGTIGNGMDLGGSPAAAAADVLLCRAALAAGSAAVRLDGGAVDALRRRHLQRDQAGEHRLPGAVVGPAAEAVVNRAVWAIQCRQSRHRQPRFSTRRMPLITWRFCFGFTPRGSSGSTAQALPTAGPRANIRWPSTHSHCSGHRDQGRLGYDTS